MFQPRSQPRRGEHYAINGVNTSRLAFLSRTTTRSTRAPAILRGALLGITLIVKVTEEC
jgi:hypothetical protein